MTDNFLSFRMSLFDYLARELKLRVCFAGVAPQDTFDCALSYWKFVRYALGATEAAATSVKGLDRNLGGLFRIRSCVCDVRVCMKKSYVCTGRCTEMCCVKHARTRTRAQSCYASRGAHARCTNNTTHSTMSCITRIGTSSACFLFIHTHPRAAITNTTPSPASRSLLTTSISVCKR